MTSIIYVGLSPGTNQDYNVATVNDKIKKEKSLAVYCISSKCRENFTVFAQFVRNVPFLN